MLGAIGTLLDQLYIARLESEPPEPKVAAGLKLLDEVDHPDLRPQIFHVLRREVVDQPIWNREDSNLVADFHAPNFN